MSMGIRPSFSREAKLQWAGSREEGSPFGQGGAFFLTSLFIELIENCPSGSISEMAMLRHFHTIYQKWSSEPVLDGQRRR